MRKKKKLVCNFFKLDVLRKKGYVDKMVPWPCSPKEKKNNFLEKKGLNYLKEQLPLRKKGLSCFKKQLPSRSKFPNV
jgi:hypothetical protein